MLVLVVLLVVVSALVKSVQVLVLLLLVMLGGVASMNEADEGGGRRVYRFTRLYRPRRAIKLLTTSGNDCPQPRPKRNPFIPTRTINH